jgi:hypothetical protein
MTPLKPYLTHVTYEYHADDEKGATYFRSEYPWFKVWKCAPTGQTVDDPNPLVSIHDFNDGTTTGSFDIPANLGGRVELDTGHCDDIWDSDYGYHCWFTVTYQSERMSPDQPKVTSMQPETYGNSVTLSWTPVQDTANPNAPPGTPVSGVVKYWVQQSTHSDFFDNPAPIDAGLATGYTFNGLSFNRCFAKSCGERDYQLVKMTVRSIIFLEIESQFSSHQKNHSDEIVNIPIAFGASSCRLYDTIDPLQDCIG